ncbi:hypothetical protein EDB83DRAFT_2316626 [Lactarius deliciosus]|nr:hypothetical protein EDB83DRAFT_2316626 [Lactarius deliciosus]
MKKDKDAMNHWSEADEATLVHTLASEKAKSNWGDNGPKKIKQEFETMKELRGLSGFGWDDVKNTVTATDEVWEAYLAPESHKRGKNESYGGVGVPLSQRGVTDILALNQAIAPGPTPKEPGASFFNGDKYDMSEDEDLVKMPASPEPPKHKRTKNMDPKTKDKKQRVTAAEGISNVLSSMRNVLSSMRNVLSSMRNVADSVHAAATAKLNMPQVFAIKAIKKDEGLTCSELTSTVECVMGDAEFANIYLAVDDAGVHMFILCHKLEKFDSRVL